MTSPFAEYELTEVPPIAGFVSSMALGSRLVLHPAETTTVSRRRDDLIFVQGSNELFARGWGGTRNHHVRCTNGVWSVHDLGHASPIWFNGARIVGHSQVLRSGDRVQPARGLTFTFFVREDLEPLAAELASQLHVLEAEEGVLIDWVLERGVASREDARRALTHFRYRLAVSGRL